MDRQIEQRLLGAARKGETDAFLALFDAHHRPLFRFAYRLTGSAADAEDIVQECFLALLADDGCFDPSRAALRSYLYGAVRNQALKRQRRRETAVAEPPGPAPQSSPETRLLGLELAAAIERAISGLPFNQREVLLLAHYEQFALADIAQLLDLDLGAVKSRLQRARTSLRALLADFAPSPGRPVR